ncbi:MAG: hypothetical protein QOG03_331 [Actinomycetota bacterium]|jgi:hypothetical protein|nr:hypothetical protein [Actinomycetota bacterium]
MRTRRRGGDVITRLLVLTALASLMSTGLVGSTATPKPEVRSRTLAVPTTRAVTGHAVHAPLPIEMVGFTWTGAPTGSVEVRAKQGGRWSPWTEVGAGPDEGPDPTSPEHTSITSAGPLWVGSGVREISVRVKEGSPTDVKAVLIHSTSPSSGGAMGRAAALPVQPAIITRAQWGADESYRTYASGCDGSASYASSGVRYAVIHHTVNSNSYSSSQSAALVRGLYYFHTHTNAWCDIGYNFLVDRFGQVFEGRYGGITKAVIGAHAGGFNTGSTGVALIGDFANGYPTAAMRSGLVNFLGWKLGYHGIDPKRSIYVTSGGTQFSRYPAGTVISMPTIIGHRDVDTTECPGDHEYVDVARLRDDVQRYELAGSPNPMPGWTPAATGPGLLTMNAYGGLLPVAHQGAIYHSAYWSGFRIARDVVKAGNGGIYVLDGYGAVHPEGGAPSVVGGPYWNGWDIARALAPAVGTGLYVFDGYGGIHALNGAVEPLGAPYFGFDIARDAAALPDGTGGYELDGYGGIHAYGRATPVRAAAYWNGWDIARSIAVRPDGVSGYVLDGLGGLHPFGGAPDLNNPHYTPNADMARQIVLNTAGDGGWMLDNNGDVWPFGNASALKTSLTYTGTGLGRSLVLTSAG